MNQTHFIQKRRHVIGLLLRRTPVLIAAGLIAAWITWTMLGPPTQEITARQAMATQNVGWFDIAAAHERNQSWFESEKANLLADTEGVELILELPNDLQLTLFSFVATADNVQDATAVASRAAEELIESQGGYVPITLSIRDTLLAESAELAEEEASSKELISEMRDQLDELIETNAPGGDQEDLAREIALVEIERAMLSQRATNVEIELAELDVSDLSLLSIIERLGSPAIEQTETDVRFRSSLLASFVAASIVGILLLWLDRRSQLRSVGQLRYHFPGLNIIDLDPANESLAHPPAGPQAALGIRLRARTATGHAIVLPTGPAHSSEQAIATIKALQPDLDVGFALVADDIDFQRMAEVDHVILAVTLGESRGTGVIGALEQVSDVPPESVFAVVLPKISHQDQPIASTTNYGQAESRNGSEALSAVPTAGG